MDVGLSLSLGRGKGQRGNFRVTFVGSQKFT